MMSMPCNSLRVRWTEVGIHNKGGFDLGDEDEKEKLEELKVEVEPLMTLIKEVLSDKIEKVIENQTADVH